MFRGISLTTLLLVALATAACLGLGDCGKDNGTGPGGSIEVSCNSSVTGGQVPFEVQFTAAVRDKSGFQFIWDFGDGTRSSGDAVAKIYTRSGTYTATVIARKGTDETTCRLQIAATSAVQVEAVTAEPDNGRAPLEVRFAARTVNLAHSGAQSSSALTYRWDFGDGGTSTEANPVHVYRQAGGYRARVTIESGSARAEETVMVTVYGPLDVACSASPLWGAPPLTVSFSASAAGQGQCSYTWDFDDSYTGSGATASHRYESGGRYYRPTVTAVCGQLQGACRQTITVGADPHPTPWPDPNGTPTPGGGGTPTPTPGGGGTPTPTRTPTPAPTPTPDCSGTFTFHAGSLPASVPWAGGFVGRLQVSGLSSACRIATAVHSVTFTSDEDLSGVWSDIDVSHEPLTVDLTYANLLRNSLGNRPATFSGLTVGQPCGSLRLTAGAPSFTTALPPYTGTYAPHEDRMLGSPAHAYNGLNCLRIGGSSQLNGNVTVLCWSMEVTLRPAR